MFGVFAFVNLCWVYPAIFSDVDPISKIVIILLWPICLLWILLAGLMVLIIGLTGLIKECVAGIQHRYKMFKSKNPEK